MSTTTTPPMGIGVGTSLENQQPAQPSNAQAEQQSAPMEAMPGVASGRPRQTRIPTLSPYLAPFLICSNRDCSRPMTPQVVTDKGGERSLRYDCENCNYSFYSSMVHASGISKPLGSDNKNPPEVLGRR